MWTHDTLYIPIPYHVYIYGNIGNMVCCTVGIQEYIYMYKTHTHIHTLHTYIYIYYAQLYTPAQGITYPTFAKNHA